MTHNSYCWEVSFMIITLVNDMDASNWLSSSLQSIK